MSIFGDVVSGTTVDGVPKCSLHSITLSLFLQKLIFIFVRFLVQELSEHLGIRLLNERLSDPTMLDSFESIFPRDNPKNTRFSINFFTSIGLGGITENLREYLKNMPRLIMQQQKPVSESDEESGSSGFSDASSSASDSGSSSSDDESESDNDERRKKRRRR